MRVVDDGVIKRVDVLHVRSSRKNTFCDNPDLLSNPLMGVHLRRLL
jgi:hypothetical protein